MRKISNEHFNHKYYLYKNMIYSIAYTYVHNAIDADDIVQEVFIKYLKSDEVFITLDNEKYWLIRVTINTAKSYLKKSWKKIVQLDDEKVNLAASVDVRDNDEMYQIVCSLPRLYKEIIVLYYYEELSINDISKVLNISISAVKKRLERGRNLIKNKEAKNG